MEDTMRDDYGAEFFRNGVRGKHHEEYQRYLQAKTDHEAEATDELLPEYKLSELKNRVRGKYHSDGENTPKHLQITPEEDTQAFNLLSFDSGDVVVSYLGDNDRLLKTVDEADEVVYLHQRFGRLAGQTALDKPEWHTIFTGDHCSPQEAVDRGEQRLGNEGIIAVTTE